VATLEQIETAFAEAGIAGLPEAAYQQFESYLELLLRWNQSLNLTAIREPEEIIRRHFVECAFVAQHLPAGIRTLLDFGSGAGLPGIPIAICRREILVTLAESQGKKASFLREVLRVLGISGDVHAGRVESLSEKRRFDAVSMRAVEKMPLAIPIALEHVDRYLILLATEKSAVGYQKLAPGLRWHEATALPNSVQMMMAVGQRR
jgi:16S rRNA (guanine527-N7)-methyltransferase